ncbi:MAG TPA: SDR family NAD(P)-dependent oxidoreductase [Draconibacterium sp.]|nr:SDR family NAD(P)-dependent oxidoreductase [Draconibacterium sp.]
MKTKVNETGNGFSKLFKLNGEPKIVAKGFALGSFIGMLPFPGFQWMISATLAAIMKLNKTAAIAGVYNTNLATGAFIFAFNYWLGSKLLGVDPSFQMPNHVGLSFTRLVFESGFDVFLSLLLGGLITGFFVTFISYRIAFSLLTRKSLLGKNYRNQVAETNSYTLITGASTGLGKELAFECANFGMNLILTALPGEGIKKIGNELSDRFQISVKTFELDFTKSGAVEQMVKSVNQNFKVNMLINNAGIGGTKSFLEASAKYIDQIILLNMRALVLLTRLLLPNLKRQNRAYILNIASMASFGPMPFKTVYPASKAFVYSFSRGLSSELKGTGITVCVAHPGAMKTNAEVTRRINNHGPVIQVTTLSAARVAKICICQLLRDNELIIPGFMNKISWILLKVVPVSLRLKLMKCSLKKELAENRQIIPFAG